MQLQTKRIKDVESSQSERRNPKSAVVLTTHYLPCLNTLKEVLASDCVVTGVVFCNKKGLRNRVFREIKRIKQYGLLKRISQCSVSLIHRVVDSTSDRGVWETLYGNITVEQIIESLGKRDIPYIETSAYDSNESMAFIKAVAPEFLVCHTPYWVNKCVREIPKEKVSIGSHPGFVPYYRGAHSAFWCVYDGHSELNGYSIFCLDEGVDSGPLIERKKIQYKKTISFRANDLLLLSLISTDQARIAENFSKGIPLDLVLHKDLDLKQVRKAPGLIEYHHFRKMLPENL